MRKLWLRGFLGALTMALGIAAAAPSCSLVVDSNAVMCDNSIPCASGSACVDGVCISDPNAGSSCTKTQECIDAKGEEFQFCRKDGGAATGTCVALKSSLCQVVDGDYKADNVFLIGSIHPTTAPPPDDFLGTSLEQSISVAIADIKKINGLPPAPGQTGNRQVVMIGCSDQGESGPSVEAANHLVNNLGVQAIIGGAFSSLAIKTATDVTIPKKVLFMTASGTSPLITDLADKPSGSNVGLVWRTVPSDNFQAKALVEYVKTVEADVRASLGLMASEPIKLALVHSGDAYGTGLKDALQPELYFNDKLALANMNNYIVANYGDPEDVANPPDYQGAISAALAGEPHIVLFFGGPEAVSDVFGPIELNWPMGKPKPRYVFSDYNFTADLASAVGSDANWRARTTGVVPGPGDNDPLYKAFQISYGTRDGDASLFGCASAYDAAYLLFYAAATIQDGIITGEKLALGLTKMSKADPPEAKINVGTAGLGAGLAKLLSGDYKSIDYNGAFGPLNFDSATGEPAANIQVFCLADDGAGKAANQLSGMFYNADTKAIEGQIAAACK